MRLVVGIFALLLAVPAFAADISIRLQDGLIWTKVQTKGGPLNFVVDTGAASTVVSSQVARTTDLKVGASISVAAVGTRTAGYRGSHFQATAAGLELPRNVIVIDLSGPGRSCSQPIDGLIGADFFKGKVVEIDYARRVMHCTDTAPSTLAGSIPLRFQNGIICVQVSLDGCAPRWTRLDTGCVDPLHWSFPGTKWTRGQKPVSVGLQRTARSRALMPLQVGGMPLGNVPVTFHSREIFPGEAGLLGNAVLSKYCVTIDGVNNRLALR